MRACSREQLQLSHLFLPNRILRPSCLECLRNTSHPSRLPSNILLSYHSALLARTYRQSDLVRRTGGPPRRTPQRIHFLFVALLRNEPYIDRTRIATTSLPITSKAEYTLLAKSKRAVASRLLAFPHTLDQSVGSGSEAERYRCLARTAGCRPRRPCMSLKTTCSCC